MSARKRDDRPGLAALEHRDDAGVRDTGLDLVAEPPQLLGDDLRGARLAIAELGMLMEVAPPGHDLRRQLLRQSVDLRANGLAACARHKRRARQTRGRPRSTQTVVLAHAAIL